MCSRSSDRVRACVVGQLDLYFAVSGTDPPEWWDGICSRYLCLSRSTVDYPTLTECCRFMFGV